LVGALSGALTKASASHQLATFTHQLTTDLGFARVPVDARCPG